MGAEQGLGRGDWLQVGSGSNWTLTGRRMAGGQEDGLRAMLLTVAEAWGQGPWTSAENKVRISPMTAMLARNGTCNAIDQKTLVRVEGGTTRSEQFMAEKRGVRVVKRGII